MAEQKKVLDSRAKVIIAACEMIGEDPASTLSVRAVASRAGVSMGSLRHHFPTQRALRDAVLQTIYDVATPDDQIIHDESVPASERLVQCLRQILAPQVGEKARDAWIKVFDAFIRPDPTEQMRTTYTAMSNEGLSRMEHWLTVLDKEGVVADGDVAKQAGFLNAVITGISIERALPGDLSALERENAILYTAVDAVLKSPR
ncbi:TetR/AcrR family transcriptional regulator [Rhodococcoides kyotonense]|uniref:DNA-binding transcriptional regulator, AcrR family n=1 Tax=Rhodococcoides kyotonense TaxID=398843 RepID=A0A239LH41_9NOCA|nr:TetR/AcrR family transcriptional regulator [Rhodococcus kyotonensis]SNT29232.1 DNA-binding transcriptional regulator, AcrR family [Rhodococcus kyotonensis]